MAGVHRARMRGDEVVGRSQSMWSFVGHEDNDEFHCQLNFRFYLILINLTVKLVTCG